MRKAFYLILILTAAIWAKNKNGLWVVRYALFEKDAATNIISSAKRLGVSKLFVQVYALGQKYYTIDSMQAASTRKSVLKELVIQAHKNKIEVHAWINCFFIYGSKKLPTNKQHIYWQAKNSVLTPLLKTGGDKGIFLYPGSKRNMKALDSVVIEMIEKYNVDGIHLDYFRYPDYDVPLSRSARTDFKLKYFIDPFTILNQTSVTKQENFVYYKHFVSIYRNFLIKKLTDALIHINKTVKKISPTVQISVAVKPDPIASRVNYLQFWTKWLKSGSCDFVVAMNYSKNPDVFRYNLRMIDRLEQPSKIMIGIAAHNITSDMMYERLKQINHRNLYSFSLFSYKQLNLNKNLENKIGRLTNGNN